jgi:hypothetical protein
MLGNYRVASRVMLSSIVSCVLNPVSSSDNTFAVTKQIGSGLTCVQISAGMQTVVAGFQLVTHHPAIRCCSPSHWRPPLWSSGQSSWLQIPRPGFDSRHYQKKLVGLERGPLSLVSTTEELLDRKVAAPV